MEDIFEQDREDNLPSTEKETCQTLLLTISVKNKVFNENQRNTAKKLLQRLEGDRRRKCRTSNIGAEAHAADEVSAPTIRKELLITKKKRKSKGAAKKAKGDESDSETDDKDQKKKKKARAGSEVDEDGYLKHSDDEEDWSDVDDGKNLAHVYPDSAPQRLISNLLATAMIRPLQERNQGNQYETSPTEEGMGPRQERFAKGQDAMASVPPSFRCEGAWHIDR